MSEVNFPGASIEAGINRLEKAPWMLPIIIEQPKKPIIKAPTAETLIFTALEVDLNQLGNTGQ